MKSYKYYYQSYKNKPQSLCRRFFTLLLSRLLSCGFQKLHLEVTHRLGGGPVHCLELSATCLETTMSPFSQRVSNLFFVNLALNAALISYLHKSLVTFLYNLNSRLAGFFLLENLKLVNKLKSLLAFALLLHVFFSKLTELLLKHELMSLFTHKVLDCLSTLFKLFHHPLMPLFHLVFFIFFP